MFNKKPRRNFRQRKNVSSDEEEQEQLVEKKGKEADLSRGGCSEARERDSGDEDEPARAALQSKPQTLSFLHEKDGTEESFKVKWSGTREVVFQARRKEDRPAGGARVKKNEDVRVQSDSDAGSSVEDLPPDSGDDDDDEEEDDDDDKSSSSTSTSSSSSKPQRVIIPDARKIRAAKEKRRQARAQKDYIALDSPHTPGSLQEEDLSNEDHESDNDLDDHERRIEFAPKPKTLRERMSAKMGSDSDQSYSDSQEEEQKLWEEQQIRKGVKRHQKEYQAPRRPRREKMVIPETLPPVNINIIKRRITTKLDSLREVHRAREAELRRMQLDVDMAKNSLENLENHAADEQLRFYRTMNVFSQNLLECLSEKMVLINSIELEMHSLYIDQAEALLSQRREVLKEESLQIQKLTYNTDSHSNGNIPGDSDPAQQSLPEENIGCEYELLCDCEPTVEQKAELQSKREDLLRKAQEVFSDVQTDFWDVKKILSRFDEWRVSFRDTYSNAYIGLCLPKLLSPLIRHQLIGWNPLQEDCDDFEALPWYSAVESFCHGQGYEESENMDKTTLPSIIQKTILPKVQGFVELVWDPLSMPQSRTLATLCRRIQDDYSVFDGEKSKPVKAFVEAVTQRLRSAVDDDVFVPLYPKKFLEDKRSPQFQFQNKQIWSAVKLLGNIALWDGLIPEHVLKELMLDKLLNRYVMITLLNESDLKHNIQKCKKVADAFPDSWFIEVDGGSSLPQLQNFSKHLLQTVHAMGKDSGTRSLLTDVLMVLKNIKAHDCIRTVTEKCHCEDLLTDLQ